MNEQHFAVKRMNNIDLLMRDGYSESKVKPKY